MGDGIERIYSDVLPTDGRHANVFHHVCVKVEGTLEDWDTYFAALGPDRPVVYIGFVEGARFCYTDERDTIGMYVEHIWFSPEVAAMMKASVPTYSSR